MDKIAVLIPCYNEEKTIEKVVRDAKAVLPEAVIYVYNNNSTDRTAELAEKAGAVVRQEYKQGKGNVIRRMFQEVDALCYIMVDGDDTYPMENAREMADKARSLWLSLNFAGEYPSTAKPVRIKRRNYVPMFPPYDFTNTVENVRKKFLKVFSEEFTDQTLNRAIADKELIEYKGDVYVVCKKRKGEASYNSCVDCVRNEGNGKFTVVMAVKMPPNGNKRYVDLPTEKNAAGEFVFTDYPYWDKSE